MQTVKARQIPTVTEPHTGMVTAAQKQELIYNVEMALFHLWDAVHGTGQGYTRWLVDNDTDGFIDRMIVTVSEGGNNARRKRIDSLR